MVISPLCEDDEPQTQKAAVRENDKKQKIKEEEMNYLYYHFEDEILEKVYFGFISL